MFLCPECRVFLLKTYQINLDTAVYLCQNKNCAYPKGHKLVLINRTLKQLIEEKKSENLQELDQWLNRICYSDEVDSSIIDSKHILDEFLCNSTTTSNKIENDASFTENLFEIEEMLGNIDSTKRNSDSSSGIESIIEKNELKVLDEKHAEPSTSIAETDTFKPKYNPLNILRQNLKTYSRSNKFVHLRKVNPDEVPRTVKSALKVKKSSKDK